MAVVGSFGLRNGIIISIDDFIEISRNDFGYFVEFLKIKSPTGNIARQCQGSQIAHRHLIGVGIFHNFGAEVRTAYRTNVLLV